MDRKGRYFVPDSKRFDKELVGALRVVHKLLAEMYTILMHRTGLTHLVSNAGLCRPAAPHQRPERQILSLFAPRPFFAPRMFLAKRSRPAAVRSTRSLQLGLSVRRHAGGRGGIGALVSSDGKA